MINIPRVNNIITSCCNIVQLCSACQALSCTQCPPGRHECVMNNVRRKRQHHRPDASTLCRVAAAFRQSHPSSQTLLQRHLARKRFLLHDPGWCAGHPSGRIFTIRKALVTYLRFAVRKSTSVDAFFFFFCRSTPPPLGRGAF